MKEILLRVAAVLAEVAVAKCAQPRGGDFARAGEVFLAQNALDPDIDRERAEAFVGEEHDAISDLGADAGQRAEVGAELVV